MGNATSATYCYTFQVNAVVQRVLELAPNAWHCNYATRLLRGEMCSAIHQAWSRYILSTLHASTWHIMQHSIQHRDQPSVQPCKKYRCARHLHSSIQRLSLGVYNCVHQYITAYSIVYKIVLYRNVYGKVRIQHLHNGIQHIQHCILQ